MKRKVAAIITSAVLFSNMCLASPGHSSEFTAPLSVNDDGIYCADAYQAKFARIQKYAPWRVAAEVAIDVSFAAAGVAGAIGYLGTVIVYGTAVQAYAAYCMFMVGFIPPAVTGSAGDALFQVFNREPGLRESYATIMSSKVSLQDLKNKMHEETLAQEVASQNGDRKNV